MRPVQPEADDLLASKIELVQVESGVAPAHLQVTTPSLSSASTDKSAADGESAPTSTKGRLSFAKLVKVGLCALCSNPILTFSSLITFIVAVMTALDGVACLFDRDGLTRLLLLIQFSWLSLLFPSGLAQIMEVPWNTPFSAVLEVLFHFAFLILIGGSLVTLIEVWRDCRLSKVRKILWSVLVSLSTIVVCPLFVPIYVWFSWFPGKCSSLSKRARSQQPLFTGEEKKNLKIQLGIVAGVILATVVLNVVFISVAGELPPDSIH